MIDYRRYASLALQTFQRIWDVHYDPSEILTDTSIEHLSRLFQQVYEQGRKDENEACAKLAEDEGWDSYGSDPEPHDQIRKRITNANLLPSETVKK